MAEPIEPTITRNSERSRYEASLDGAVVGYSDYLLTGDVVVFPHTVTEPEYGGRGVASALARFSLDDVRARGGLTVLPQCSFYADWIRRHPEYADLLA